MNNLSKTDVAYHLLKERAEGLNFYEIWDFIKNDLSLSDDEADDLISSFYTDLSLDSRFITLGENVWDLRENNSFDKVHIDMNDIYANSDDDVIESEDGIITKEDTDEVLFEDDEPKATKENK
ncbi:MAG: DNA-directed RNA polymerase subunit delta [Bacilli bacterium]|jgi:DNA-directed RNA polymerase subunit delta|nr:DNA-directed RNA polymerase subunit delta [Bacilli bacterium]